MRAVKMCLLAAIVATSCGCLAEFLACSKKRLDTQDTELRLMAMLYVSVTAR
jgi:hypothetical protein